MNKHSLSRGGNQKRPGIVTRGVGLSLLAASLSPASLFAQGTGAESGQGPKVSGIDEIVVTARRRQEAMQDVPIAITALSAEELRNHKIDRIDDLQYQSPGLTVTQAGTSSHLPVISLRGQRPSEAAIHLESAVPIYFADVVMAPSHGTNISMYDLENVQVLKGPQGTLFGRNSTGGAILFSPTRPGQGFGGYAEVTLGNYDLIETEAAVDLPVSESLRFRVAGRTVDRDGYQTNVASNPETRGDKLWDEESRSLRISMVADITEDLENYLVVNWDKNDTKGRQTVIRAVNPQTPFGSFLAESAQRQIARDDPFSYESDLEERFDNIESWFGANTTTWDLNGVTLKNIFGYRKMESLEMQDVDSSSLNLVQSPLGRPNWNEAEQFSNEFQVQGTAFDERLEWIAGAYYYLMDGTRESVSGIFGIRENEINGDVENESHALFLQGTYDATDRLSLTLGARRSWDSRELTVRHRNIVNHPVMGRMVSCNVFDEQFNQLPLDQCSRTVDEDWSSDTWLVNLSYDLTEGAMAYGSISTGYRSGGFNIRATNNTGLVPFDEETVTNYEVGLKSDWSLGDMDIRSNLAFYYQDYEDLQRSRATAGPDNTVIAITDNAATAEIKGLDFELNVYPITGLMLSLNYALVDTEYEEYLDTTANPPFDRAGEQFRWVPEHQVTATARYTLPLDPAIGEVSLQANLYYQSKVLRDGLDPAVPVEFQRDIWWEDSYTLQNYRVDWRSVMQSSVDLSLFVKNASDEVYAIGGLTALDSLGLAAYNYGAPRTWGAELRYSF